LHGRPTAFAVSEIAFAYRLADQFEHGRLFAASAGMERSPYLVIAFRTTGVPVGPNRAAGTREV
jgi:hypothetical protein